MAQRVAERAYQAQVGTPPNGPSPEYGQQTAESTEYGLSPETMSYY